MIDLPYDWYIVLIVFLLPITAMLLVLQKNPYHALVIRGILGAIAALVYTLFGAADVALTEALVGTMLSITLYAVAVRSSMTMRLGMLAPESDGSETVEHLFSAVRQCLNPHYLRLEPVIYDDPESLNNALLQKDIHAMLQLQSSDISWLLTTRVSRLYDICKSDTLSSIVELRHLALAEPGQDRPHAQGEHSTLMENQS